MITEKPNIRLIIKVAEVVASVTVAIIDILTGRKKYDRARSSKKK